MSYPELNRCIEVIRKLRHPVDGCPWDLAQTHESLLKYLIEESYEFIEAVESKKSAQMEEELGDVLLQILLHATIGEQNKAFTLESVAKTLADKMIHRHPHVFSPDGSNMSPDEVVIKWKEQKAKESGAKKYTIDKKLLYAPALDTAFRIGEKSTTVNFDWSDYHQVMMKVEEEWQEVKEELPPGNQFNRERVKEEIGDLLFSVAQLARHVGLHPEDCLKDANKKFIRRFQKVEDMVKGEGKSLTDKTSAQLEEYWVKVKKNET